jgi:uncharacterized membrane protein YkvA (DUF1232 family)
MPAPRSRFLAELVLSWRALFDRRTPFIAKLLILLGIVYGVSPIDVLPDFLPLIGQLDDLGILVIVILSFLRMSKSVRQDLRKRDIVETTARVS